MHSRSPILFEHWFRATGIAGRYVPLAIRPERFAEVYKALPHAGFRGINVTIPHKLDALRLADEASAAARAIGAANMIRFGADGRIVADNTDAFGFIENLRHAVPDWRAATGPALVLGAGGASRAILHGLLAEGAPEIRLTNRTHDKAMALAEQFGPRVTCVDWAERAAAGEGVALVVNATSLGMTGKPPLEMLLDAVPAGAVVNDIVYVPLETPLLAEARRRGLRPVDGLGMLLHQARPAFRAWFGTDPRVDDALRRACLGEGG